VRVLVISAWAASFVHQQVAELKKQHTVEYLFLDYSNGPRLLVALAAIWAGVRWTGERPDVVHSYSAWPAGIVGAIIAFRKAVPHIVQEHLHPDARFKTLPLVSWVIESANRVVAYSRTHADELESLYGRPVTVVNNHDASKSIYDMPRWASLL
jgi:glycosyltransferase involved in cell wall biosynthesis